MKEPHLLRAASNPRRLLANLSHLLSPDSRDAIERELEANVVGLYSLGRQHYQFARRLGPGSWRQAVSRLYYAGYHAARSVRLCVEGHYSQDVKDHHKFDKLPDDFPNKAMYANRLALLRDDRNLCDYDHTTEVADLAESPADWSSFVSEFLSHTKSYLKARGISI